MTQSIRTIQQQLSAAGFDTGGIDGAWGPRSQAALDAALSAASLRCDAVLPAENLRADSIAWSAKVNASFAARVSTMAEALQMPQGGANWIMAAIAWESGETFSPSVRNMAGSGATGLIQFMPATARGLGTTTDELASMTALAQLEYVYRYFLPYRGRLNSLGDVYMAILWPAGIGKPLDWPLWDQASRPTTYRQNAGLDINRDGVITKGEAAAKVQDKLDKGMLPQSRRSA